MRQRRTGAETRQRIVEAAAALIEERGSVDISVIEITRRAGVSRTAFYRQFPDLYAVVSEILEAIGHQLLANSGAWLNDPTSLGSPEVVYDNLLSYARAYEPVGRLLGALTDAAGIDERVYVNYRRALQAFIDAQAAAIARDQAAGAVRPDLDPVSTSYGLTLMSERLSSDLMGRHPRGGPDDYARIMAPIWTRLLFREEDRRASDPDDK